MPAAAGPCAAVLEGYRHYLASERGLTGPEVTRHVQTAGMFAEHARAADRGWAAVTAADVTGFAVAQCAALGRASACKRISQLRSFLRFAHLSGLTAAALAPAVPPAAWWSASSLPRWVPPGQVAALLAACDQRTAHGRRDFAIVTLLSRLGLRAGEVAAMQLGDIDWRAGTLTVRGKARREEKMPLPADAGEAIASYLADGRPAAAGRCSCGRWRRGTGCRRRACLTSWPRRAAADRRPPAAPLGGYRDASTESPRSPAFLKRRLLPAPSPAPPQPPQRPPPPHPWNPPPL